MHRPTLLLLVLLLPPCTAWQPVAVPTPESTGWTATGRLRVTTHWGTLSHGDSAWIAGDTLMLIRDGIQIGGGDWTTLGSP